LLIFSYWLKLYRNCNVSCWKTCLFYQPLQIRFKYDMYLFYSIKFYRSSWSASTDAPCFITSSFWQNSPQNCSTSISVFRSTWSVSMFWRFGPYFWENFRQLLLPLSYRPGKLWQRARNVSYCKSLVWFGKYWTVLSFLVRAAPKYY